MKTTVYTFKSGLRIQKLAVFTILETHYFGNKEKEKYSKMKVLRKK